MPDTIESLREQLATAGREREALRLECIRTLTDKAQLAVQLGVANRRAETAERKAEELAAALQSAIAHLPRDLRGNTWWEDDEGTWVEHEWSRKLDNPAEALTSRIARERKLGAAEELRRQATWIAEFAAIDPAIPRDRLLERAEELEKEAGDVEA